MNDTKTFQFELVSPAEKLISEPARYVSVPGSEGVFGVLPGHASLISALKPGVVTFKNADQGHEDIFIAGGFADVTADNLTILAEEAESVASLDKISLEKELSNLEDDLKLVEGAIDQKRIEKKIELTKIKLSLAS